MPIPELPGQLVPRELVLDLKRHVAHICGLDHERFPGAQPVSFGTQDLLKLEAKDFWVCEKSDGVRVLLFVHTLDAETQMVYLIDRHNSYRVLNGLFFPHHENPTKPLRDTILDGELLIDIDPRSKTETLRFLAFDCLVVDGQNVMSRPLDKRYGRLKEWFHRPYARMMRDHPHMTSSVPFDIQVKVIRSSYHVEEVFEVDMKALHHESDGLIYTCVNSPYNPGTDPNIMKWKPPSENSIDFKLVLRFPPCASDPTRPDFVAKPVFLLHVWCGDEKGMAKYEEFDQLYVEDDEWENMKLSGEQYDDRIIEVHWDPSTCHWRMMRFRDDKPNGNHKNVVDNIITSISDGVEKAELVARSSAIRAAWKNRESQPVNVVSHAHHAVVEPLDLRYGPLGHSPWSKVSGPSTVAGVFR